MNPLISIIIPVYNSEKYVFDTINSCLNQSYSDIEIIIVNDGSKDNSENIINQFDDKRIKYFLIPNSGPCYARNYGISKASGELFQFLDADDILDERKLEEQVKQYKLNGDSYVYSGTMGKIVKDAKALEPDFDFYYVNLTVENYFREMFGNFGKYFTTGIWLLPRKLVEQTHGWDEKILLNNDGEYFSRVILQSKGIIYCREAIFYYRRDVANSVSKQRNSKRTYESWLYSYSCYVNGFRQTFDEKTANELGRKALSVYYCNSYPKYPDLLHECKEQIRQLGYRSASAHGSKFLKFLSLFLGTDYALRVRSFKDHNGLLNRNA